MIIVTRVTIHYWGDYKCYCAIIICILDQEVHYTHIVLQCHGMHTTIFNKFVPRYMTLYMFLHVIPTTKSSQSHASWIWGMNSEFSPLTNPLPTFTTNQGINIPYIIPYSLWNHSGYYEQLPVWSTWFPGTFQKLWCTRRKALADDTNALKGTQSTSILSVSSN